MFNNEEIWSDFRVIRNFTSGTMESNIAFKRIDANRDCELKMDVD